MLNLLVVIVGLGLLIGGGELLVRGASALAARLGVAPIVIGLTVVAFGTSTPELVVNLSAALKGEGAIGFGNVVGSNIANIGLLLGLGALLYPLTVHRSIFTREVPMMLLACVAMLVMGVKSATGSGGDGFTRADGIMLLLLFGVFLYYTINDARTGGGADAPEPGTLSTLRSILYVLAGLALLVVGGEATVRGATAFARAVGVAEVTIGLTIVAVGTSLPEFATTVVAARRGMADMALGNIVGSNIFNVLFIWGTTMALAPGAIPAGGIVDLLVMTGFAALLLPMVMTNLKVSRLEGGILLAGYAAYIAWRAMQ